jgi:hypothetical protein
VPDDASLRSYQIGSALGLAVMVAVQSAKTGAASAAGLPAVNALNVGFHAAFMGLRHGFSPVVCDGRRESRLVAFPANAAALARRVSRRWAPVGPRAK